MKNSRIHKAINRILDMSNPAWYVMRAAFITSCTMLFIAFIILIEIGEITYGNAIYYLFAQELFASPPHLLLVAVIISVCIEERVIGK